MGVWRRSKTVYFLSSLVCRGVLHTYFDVEYMGEDNIPEDGPVLMLPKHQAYRDIVYEGLLLRHWRGRYGYWVMKSGLPDFLGLYGAVKIGRPRDLRKIKDRDERRKAVAEAKEMKSNLRQKLKGFYEAGEVVVVHPEGTRKGAWANMLPVENLAIDFTKEIEQECGMKVPVVPVGIEYSSFWGSRRKFASLWAPRSRVRVRADRAYDVQEKDLDKLVYESIRRMSNV